MRTGWALPEIDGVRCNACGDCVRVCHAAAVAIVDGIAVIARPEVCDYCADCEAVCPTDAIRCPFEVVLA